MKNANNWGIAKNVNMFSLCCVSLFPFLDIVCQPVQTIQPASARLSQELNLERLAQCGLHPPLLRLPSPQKTRGLFLFRAELPTFASSLSSQVPICSPELLKLKTNHHAGRFLWKHKRSTCLNVLCALNIVLAGFSFPWHWKSIVDYPTNTLMFS